MKGVRERERERERRRRGELERKGREGTALRLMSRKFRVNERGGFGFV